MTFCLWFDHFLFALSDRIVFFTDNETVSFFDEISMNGKNKSEFPNLRMIVAKKNKQIKRRLLTIDGYGSLCIYIYIWDTGGYFRVKPFSIVIYCSAKLTSVQKHHLRYHPCGLCLHQDVHAEYTHTRFLSCIKEAFYSGGICLHQYVHAKYRVLLNLWED